MPRVPTSDNFQTQVAPTSASLLQAPGGPTAGAIGADQAGQFGRAASAAGDAVAKIVQDTQHEARVTVAKDVDNQVNRDTTDALYHPETGFLSKKGKDTITGFEDATQRVQKIHNDALSSLTNPETRRLAEPVMNQRLQSAIQAIDKHTAQESFRYQVETADSRAQINLQTASLNFADDKQFSQALSISRQEAMSLGKLQGWNESTTQLQATKYQDLGYKLRYEAWRLEDPMGAFASFQQSAEQISPVVRDQVGRQLFQAAAPLMAAELNRAGGYGVAAPPAAPGAGKATGPEPRGIRNNNPGNIIKTGEAWQGEVAGDDPKFASFATPEAGIRAMGKTLLTYQDKHGLNTVEAIVSRWAPATENDTAAYAATVSKALKVAVNAPLDLHDSDTLNRLTRAMIQVENGPGGARISDQQIALGLASAGSGGALPPASAPASQTVAPGRADSGLPMVDALPDDWKLHVMQLARAQGHQDMATARETLRSKAQDSSAEFLTNGYATSPPNEAEFVRAYGQSEGVARYRDFQGVASLGQTLQQVKQLPAAALARLLQSSKPTPGEGFAAREHNFEILTRAVDQVQQAREKDPVGYALSTGAYGFKPLQRLDDPKALAQELPRRAAGARQMAADYGTPAQVFTKDETAALGASIKAAPVEAQKGQLAAIFKGVGDMGLFKQTMQSLAPDNPTMAVAGVYQARGLRTTENRDVADLILRGQAILTPNTKEDGAGHMGGKSLLKMPEEKLLLSDWNNETGDAFKGKEQAADLFMQTAKAVYAARSAEEGDYSGVINSKRWKAAIGMATGGIVSHNGSKIVAPYGMDYGMFQDALKTQATAMSKAGGPDARELLRLPLENVGDGKYMFRRGAGYLVDKDGRAMVVNLTGGRP